MSANTGHPMPRLVLSDHVRHRVHGRDAGGRFNSWLAVQITRAVGSMWCAYVFVGIALVSLPQALAAFVAGDTIAGVTWLSQSFLQLVLMPVLMVGQRVIAAHQDAQSEADHETLTVLHMLSRQQLELTREVRASTAEMHEWMRALQSGEPIATRNH